MSEASGAFSRFAHQIWSAEWAANVGVPLLVTVASLAVAVFLVRTQLAHDRRLLREQHRAEIAVKLGWALRGVTEGIDEIDGGMALSTERKWNGLSPVSDATYRAQISGLPDKDDALRLAVGLARDMLWRWRSGVEFAETWKGDEDKGLLGSAVVDCLHPPKVLLNQLAEKIIRWDGRGDIPTLSVAEIGSWTPVALPAAGKTRSEHVEWKEQFRVEYVAMVERLARWS